MRQLAEHLPIRYVNESATPCRSQVKITEAGDEITLSIAELGTLAVNAAGALSSAPDSSHHERLAHAAADWAWGQWLAFGGTYAFHGATVTRDGYTLALVGAPRAGTSLTALALCRRGWALVADGVCPLAVESGKRVIALAGTGALQVDRAVTAAFPPPEIYTDARTPRPRSNIEVEAAGAHTVDRIVSLVPSTVRRGGVIVPGNFEGGDPTLSLAAASVCGEGIRSRNSELNEDLLATCAQVTALVPFDVALVPAGSSTLMFSPRQIATLITDHLAAVIADA